LTQPTLTVPLHRTQHEFCHSDALYRGFVGGRGTGKSFVGAYDLLRRAKPGRLYGVYAPTYAMLKDTALRSLLAIGEQLRFIREVNKADMRVTLGNRAEIILRSVDDPERARGPNLSGAWLEEASLMEEEAYSIIIACLREGGEAGWLSATFTPKGRQHWTYRVFGLGSPGAALFHARTIDNPFLPPDFEAAVRAQYTEQFAQQELEGEFIDLQGTLFQRQWFRMVERAPDGLSWTRYWDLAASTKTGGDYTTSAAVALGSDGTLYIRDMVRGRWEWPDAKRIIMTTMLADVSVVHGIEEALHGLAAVQELAREPSLAHCTVRGITVDKDKFSRALPWAARAERGQVALVRGPWTEEFLAEVIAFPLGVHDDQVDTISGGVQMLGRSHTGGIFV
jgi:predicted phage terminase large subunit-like protein